MVAGAVLGTKPVRLEGATLTSKQVHAFCDHIYQLVRARVFDSQTFTLLTTPQSIMAMGLRFMTSEVMARKGGSPIRPRRAVTLVRQSHSPMPKLPSYESI